MNKFELLLPAGNFQKGQYAFEYGADAIYVGLKAYSLRARSSNFDFDELTEITKYAHSLNKKIYVVLNIICHNSHLRGFEAFFKKINKINVDGAIVADPYIFSKIKAINPNFSIHISTQQSICNSKAAKFWKDNGASRIVVSREMCFNELKLMLKNLNNLIEIEYFIHGAVCISYSGRCMMSNNFSLRDANVGGCAQSCRWNYQILDCDSKGKFFTMSAKDMCLIDDFKKLMTLNIASFKVEGRMRSLHYVSTVAACYRYVIDNILNKIEYNKLFVRKEIQKAENRLADKAWFDKIPNKNKMLYFEDKNSLKQLFAFVFKEKIDDKTYVIISKNFFTTSNKFELVLPNLKNILFKINTIIEDDKYIDVVNKPMQEYVIKISRKIPEWKNRVVRIV